MSGSISLAYSSEHMERDTHHPTYLLTWLNEVYSDEKPGRDFSNGATRPEASHKFDFLISPSHCEAVPATSKALQFKEFK